MDTYIKCAYCCYKYKLPKFIAFIIIDHIGGDEIFKYGYEVASRQFSKQFIFEKACEIENMNLVKFLYKSIDISRGLTSACLRNNLKVINFLLPYTQTRTYAEIAAYSGHVETSWLLTKFIKKARPYVLYIAVSKNLNISKFLEKKISFDHAIYTACSITNKDVIERICKHKVPTDAGLKVACISKRVDIIKILMSGITDKIAALKLFIKYKLQTFVEEISIPELANYGLILSARYSNSKAFKYFISLGATSFNKALEVVCKRKINFSVPQATYCKNCSSKYHF